MDMLQNSTVGTVILMLHVNFVSSSSILYAVYHYSCTCKQNKVHGGGGWMKRGMNIKAKERRNQFEISYIF